MAELTIEQQRALALARARARASGSSATSAPAEPEREGGFWSYVNQGIASTLGAPVDLVNSGLGAIGLPVSDRPLGGSQNISDMLSYLGIRSAPQGQAPQTLGEYAGQGVGSAVAALPGLVAGAGRVAVQAASPVVRGVAEAVRRPFVSTPGRAASSELAAGAGAGAGQYVAEQQMPESTTAQVVAPLIGGAALGMGPNLVMRGAQSLPGVQLATNLAKGEIAPFTEAGALTRARNRVGNLVENREAALAALERGSTSNLSPAVTTGDRRLVALEQAVRDQYPQIDLKMRNAEQSSRDFLTAEGTSIGGAASIDDTRQALAGRIEPLLQRVDNRIKTAEENAAKKVAALEPRRRATQSSVIVREELEKALGDARAQENKLWRAIPQDIPVPTEGAKEYYRQLLSETARANRDDIPAKAKDFLGGGNQSFKSEEPVREVHGLYSEMRKHARQARAAGEYNSARIADNVADALLADLQKVGEVEGPLRAAVDFSRQLNERFSRGNVGRILGTDRRGGSQVAPELTLQTSVGRGGPAGGVAIDEIRAGLQGDSAAIPDFVRSQLYDAAVRGGTFSPQRAESFVRQNRDVLRRTPEVEKDVAEALAATSNVARTTERMGARTDRIGQTAGARLVGAQPGEELKTILRSPNPAGMARALVQQVRKDKSGAALNGLKKTVVGEIFQGDNPARSISRAMNDPKLGGVIKEVLSPEERKRLATISEELGKLDMASSRLPNVGPIMGDEPNSIIAYVARVIAARYGARLGQGTSGASLQTAQMASGRMQRLLQRLTNDKAEELIVRAISGDAELFRSLLQPVNALTKQQENRLVETMAGILAQQSQSDDEVANALIGG